MKNMAEEPRVQAKTATGHTLRGETVALVADGATLPVTMPLTPALGDVLARAAAINQKRDGFDLSFSSLLLGLVYGGDALGSWLARHFDAEQVRVEHVLGKVHQDPTGVMAVAQKGTHDRDAILSAPLRQTSSASRALEEAERIAHAQGVTRVDTPHLLAAFIALTNYHEEDFGALSLDRLQWGRAFVQEMTRRSNSVAEGEFWRRFFLRRFPGHELPPLDAARAGGHRPDYDPDAYTSHDLLSIDDEVAALAYVIAAKQTRPPLAVGLFGEWGSGKTFFMKHLRRRIEQLCEGARGQEPAARDCHAQIAQIEFNAWHYQEGDLWASLVDHILRNLRFGEDEDEARLAERRDQIVRELNLTEERRTAAEQRAAAADELVGRAEARVVDLRAQEQQRREELAAQLTPGRVVAAARAGAALDPALRGDAEALARDLGLPRVQRSVSELQEVIGEARRELAGVWAFLIPLWRGSDRTRRLLMLGVALAVPVVLGVAIAALMADRQLIGRIAGFLTGLVTLLGTARRWLQAQTAWVRDARARVEPVARALDAAIEREIEAALSDQKRTIAETVAEIETLREGQLRAQRDRDAAAVEAAALRGNLATLGDDALMRSFLDERLGGGIYQQKLGTAALVRRDFDRLSRSIEQVTSREANGTLNTGELVINRIVLYIDDLDRCDMEKVVPVLRAVHLLLAFPAFVVVVGVDSRWVARCLERHHPDIFMSDRSEPSAAVTPLDYLEKIFQIPIWLEPVTAVQRVSMVQKLLRKRETVPGGARLPGDAMTPPARTAGAERRENEPDRSFAQESNTPPLPGGEQAGAPQDPPEINLNPEGLHITDEEHAFLGELGELLSPSPRTIKRFVNTYRLVNVTLAQEGTHDPGRNPADFQVRMLLLTVLVGMPELSQWLQDTLRRAGESRIGMPLMALMEGEQAAMALAGQPPAWSAAARAQWDMLRNWMEQRGDAWRTAPADRFVQWLQPVGRYTFNLTRAASGSARHGANPAEIAPQAQAQRA